MTVASRWANLRIARPGRPSLPDGTVDVQDRASLAGAILFVPIAEPPISTVDILGGRTGQVQWDVRFDILDADRNWTDTLNPYTRGQITWDPTNRIQRILDGMKLDPMETLKLTPGVSKIQPVFTLPLTGFERSLGVFTYFGGKKTRRQGDDWIDCVPSWDRCYQLDQKSRYPMGVDANEALTSAFVRLAADGRITAAEIDVVVSTVTLGPQPLAFAMGSGQTRMALLRQIGALLGYLPPGFSQADRLVFRPVPVPVNESPTFTYADGENSTLTADSVSEQMSVADRPNLYRVLSSQPSGIPLYGEFSIPASWENSEASTNVQVIAEKTIDGFSTAQQCQDAATAWAYQDHATVRTIEFETGPEPGHDQWDVIAYDDGVTLTRLLEVWHQLNLDTGIHSHRAKEVFTVGA